MSPFKPKKVDPFYTAEDLQNLAEIDRKISQVQADLDRIKSEISEAQQAGDQGRAAELTRLAINAATAQTELFHANNTVHAEAERRYIEAFNGDSNAILADVTDVINAITKKDYLTHHQRLADGITSTIEKLGADANTKETRQYINSSRKLATRGYSTCLAYLLQTIRVQLNAFEYYNDKDGAAQAVAIAEAKAATFYKRPKGAAGETPHIIAKQATHLDYPLDKPNSYIWNLLAATDPNGQISMMGIDTASQLSKRKGKEALVFFSINFDELENIEISKQLTPFDKRVYMAVAALFSAGNKYISTTQIHKMMGNEGQPTADQVTRINQSLDKMRSARISLNNEEEVKTNKGYVTFNYDGQLLEFRRVRAYINNTLAEAAITVLAYPPLMEFAKTRNQITKVPRQLLESPVSKTDSNLMIDDYLIERISHMKNNPKQSKKMLYSTIFEQCKIDSRMKKSRAPEKIRRYLDHYKACAFIADYAEDKDGITIKL